MPTAVHDCVFDAVDAARLPFVHIWYPEIPDASETGLHVKAWFKTFSTMPLAGEASAGAAGAVRSTVNVRWFEALVFPAWSIAFTYHVCDPTRTLFAVHVWLFEAVDAASRPFVHIWYPKIPFASETAFHPNTWFMAFVSAASVGVTSPGTAGAVRSTVNVHWFDELVFAPWSIAFTYHVCVPARIPAAVQTCVFDAVTAANRPFV
jgi:hypothetical protein